MPTAIIIIAVALCLIGGFLAGFGFGWGQHLFQIAEHKYRERRFINTRNQIDRINSKGAIGG